MMVFFLRAIIFSIVASSLVAVESSSFSSPPSLPLPPPLPPDASSTYEIAASLSSALPQDVSSSPRPLPIVTSGRPILLSDDPPLVDEADFPHLDLLQSESNYLKAASSPISSSYSSPPLRSRPISFLRNPYQPPPEPPSLRSTPIPAALAFLQQQHLLPGTSSLDNRRLTSSIPVSFSSRSIHHPQRYVPPSRPLSSSSFIPSHPPYHPPYQLPTATSLASHLVDASVAVSFDSVLKLLQVALVSGVLAYLSVSPRLAPVNLYNALFQENVLLLALLYVAPLLTFAAVFDATLNDVNKFISTFYVSFFFAYPLVFALEILLTTFVRLLVFRFLEPEIFGLTPKIPSLLLPWSLSTETYLPRYSTTLTCEILTSVLLSPLVEESVKLLVAQACSDVPRNFRRGLPIATGPSQTTSINPYVVALLGSTWGLKLADATRRVLLYTRASDADKRVYALARGATPIPELSGCLTALLWARRDVLGDGSLRGFGTLRLAMPAAIFHAVAVYRGAKPIAKWGATTPWAELQMSRWTSAARGVSGIGDDNSSLSDILRKMFTHAAWFYWLFKCFGHCFKQYFIISRQAVKRATTYAGNADAFAAELDLDRLLLEEKEAAQSWLNIGSNVFKREKDREGGGFSYGNGRER